MKNSNKILWTTIIAVFISILVILMAARIFIPKYADDSFKHRLFLNGYSGRTIVGNGKLTTKPTALANFDGINVGGWSDVTLTQGPKSNVAVTTDENLLPYLNVAVANKQLTIGYKPNVDLSPSQAIKIAIQTSTIHNVIVGGNIRFHGQNLTSDKLALSMDDESAGVLQGNIKNLIITVGGESKLQVYVGNSDTINLTLVGEGDVSLFGTTQNLRITSGGEVNVNAKDLLANNIIITSGGEANITVHPVNSLVITAGGESHVRYYGNPASITKTALGEVTIEKASE